MAMGDNRLNHLRLASNVQVPKNFVPPVFAKTALSREEDVVRWLWVQTNAGDRNCRFLLKMVRTGGMSVNDLIVEGLLRLG